jgi:signal transduction histidine kinase
MATRWGRIIEHSSGDKSSTTFDPRLVPVVRLLLWAVLWFILVDASGAPAGWDLAVAAVYTPAALFCSWSFSAVFTRAAGVERLFWGLLGGGVLLYFAGSPLWSPTHGHGSWTTMLCYAGSNAFLFGALFLLLRKVSRRVSYVAWLDALAIALSVGLLLSYFLATPAELAATASSWRAGAAAFSASVMGAGLLYLSLLLVGVDGSPAFSGLLALGFLALFVAQSAYLSIASDAGGLLGPPFWQHLLWLSGPLLLAAAARRSSPDAFNGSPWELGASPKKQAAFWFGPLSPAMHFVAAFTWAALHPPIPGYLAVGGVAFALYSGLRFALYSQAVHELRLQRDEEVGRLEQGRISEELHDTLKQNVYGTALLLDTYRETTEAKTENVANELLEGAIATSREAAHQVGRLVGELRARSTDDGLDLYDLLRERLSETREHFGIRTHEDLEADPALLDPEQRATAYRIASEALWNVAKHSGASNVSLRTKRIGSVFLLDVRDDGRGLPLEGLRPGLGISLMQDRARRAGGELHISSDPSRGTILQARFEVR